MLEYLSPPLLYRTQLDASVGDCYYSQHDIIQVSHSRVRAYIHHGCVYLDDICVLQSSRAIMLSTFQRASGAKNEFFLRFKDGREWLMRVQIDLSLSLETEFEPSVDSLSIYLRERHVSKRVLKDV